MLFIIAEATEQATEQASEVSSMVSLFDIFIISSLLGLAAYFLFWRKEEEKITIKRLDVSHIAKPTDSSLIGKMKTSGKNVVVFYGSQTGTAEEFACRLSKDCQRYGLKGIAMDPEECNMEDLANFSEIENSLAIFCMATYGEGDPTDNAQEFYNILQTGEIDLTGLTYAVFGLGNKTYEHYQSMGIYVDKRLEELGGTRIFDLGMGDDDANIEEDFLTWREKFWPTVCEHFNIQVVGDDISIRQYTLTLHDNLSPDQYFKGEMSRLGSYKIQKTPYDAKNPYLATVVVHKELHKNSERSCIHIEFDITDSKIRYDAGDHVAVFPSNNPDIVDRIGKVLDIDLDIVFTLNNVDVEANKKHPFPCPTTYRVALTHYVDVMNPLKSHVLKELSDYAKEPKDKEFMEKLSSTSPEGKQLYSEWIVKDHRNILAVLEDIPSLKPPLDHLCELLPRLQARYYSISSSGKVHPTRIHITAVLIDYVTPTGRPTKGVATGFLALQKPSNGLPNKVPIYVRKSQFRLPFKPSTPVIMVGPGTGIAPFRGFIQERDYLKKQEKVVGDTILYFGCRHKEQDFLYREELEEYIENKTLTNLHVAFSRDTDKKIYVQNLLKENKEEVWRVIESGGHFYICGDATRMARDVNETLLSIIMECGKFTDKAHATDYIKKMQARGRYSCDVWS